MSKFSQTLNYLIKQEDLTLLELQKQVGINNAQLGRYVAGYYEPSLTNAIILSNYFSCSLDFLFGLDDIKMREQIVRGANQELFLERLKYLIKANNTNENRISKQLNFARHGFLRWRKFKIFPEMSILVKLAEFFNVTIEFLIGRVD